MWHLTAFEYAPLDLRKPGEVAMHNLSASATLAIHDAQVLLFDMSVKVRWTVERPFGAVVIGAGFPVHISALHPGGLRTVVGDSQFGTPVFGRLCGISSVGLHDLLYDFPKVLEVAGEQLVRRRGEDGEAGNIGVKHGDRL